MQQSGDDTKGQKPGAVSPFVFDREPRAIETGARQQERCKRPRNPTWLASGLHGAEWSKRQDLAFGLGGRELLEQSSQVPVGIVSVGFGGFDNAE